PTYFKLILSALAEDKSLKQHLNSLNHILIAGEPLYGSDVNAWYDLMGEYIALVNLYGPSETTLAKLFYHIPKKKHTPEEIVPLGNPIANTAALIVQGNQMCRNGEEGEILIKTPFLTKGYYKNPTLTHQKFIQNPLHNDFEDIVFKTGDMGYYGDDGLIFFSGRADDMVKFNGNRIELNEIQKVAMKVPGIDQAVVQVNRSLDGSEVLALYYNSRETVDKATILHYYNAHLPFYMHPGKITYITHFPTLPNGKIDRKALQDVAVEEVPEATEITDPLELELLDIWKPLLSIDEIGNQQSFFQLGGSSLKAIQMISKIYKQKGVLLNLREILSDPTISGIKTLIETKKDSNGQEQQSSQPSGQPQSLSTIQLQILSWAKTESQWTDFNMPYIYTISGNLNPDRLEKAIRKVSQTHSFFRQHLVQTKDGFELKLMQLAFKDYLFEDHSALSREEVAAHLDHFIRTPFSKQQDVLIKLRTLKLADDQHLFVVLSHLVKSDGLTISMLMEEMVKAYLTPEDTDAHKTNDGLATHSILLDKERNANHNNGYWEKVYQNRIPLATLSGVQPFDSATLQNHNFSIDGTAVNTLETLAKTHHTAVRILLIAFFEHCLTSLLGVNSVTYYNVVSDRARYEHNFLGNGLYYLPFNVTVAPEDSLEN
ncbi:MAG: condensation domain-containing protein, partial [Bacteroidota bacterium]